MISLLSLLFAVTPVTDSGSVSSANASYDGNALVLKGQVALDHGVGKIEADEAVLERQEVGKDFPFSLIHLKQSVLLSLHNRAQARCDAADLDFSALKGSLFSAERVIYTDTSFRILGKIVDLTFEKKGQVGQKTSYDIDTAVASSNVEVEYGSQFKLFADKALYQKTANQITATSENLCRLVHENDAIESNHCKFDLTQSQIFLENPQGTIRSLLKGPLQFSSDSLVWDQPKNTICLQGRVQLQEPALGTIDTEDSIELTHGKNRQLSSIRTQGKTTIHYLNAHTLSSWGPVFIDGEKMHASAHSPLINGLVPEGQQVSYSETEITAIGDKIEADYTLSQNTLQPVSIALKGDVHLYAHNAAKPARCGIADRVTYSPQTRTFILGADPGKKVLFINDEENLRISAQEIHVTEDPGTKKQMVKGIGNVQLTFSVEEEEQMQKLLKLSKKLPQ